MVVLRQSPHPEEDVSWIFNNIHVPQSRATGRSLGLVVNFTARDITLERQEFSQNRILNNDDPTKFILVSFANLRFPDKPISAGTEYIKRFFKAGLTLNRKHYRFYGHSNSQLRGRSCYLRQAQTDAELDEKIYALGDFGGIMNVAKRAKRIGLLFSSASIDWTLDPRYIKDIGDIKVGDELFSDGCGLMALHFARQIARKKKIVYHGIRYTPSVYQIRYLGYKGVLMVHPPLDEEKQALVHFRKSMKKFVATEDYTFSVVEYSKPWSYARLNNDIIVLLSSLGISNEVFIAKQRAYFEWISSASREFEVAFDLLSSLGQRDEAERLLLDGLESPSIQRKIASYQTKEIASFRKDEHKEKARMLIRNSRILFGVCDPFQVLEEGQVHIRITSSRIGVTTLAQSDVIIVRNPCLHPGDCLKLRVVDHPKLSHLVDCVVFATVGTRAAPSMSSGGDLDGDTFTCIWDKDLIPPRIAESYTYPAGREHVSNSISRQDLAAHFASYNSASMGKAASLHAKWVRASPLGAMSPECQELNALYSSCVDGARIKFPDRLLSPPEPDTPYVLDLLGVEARKFAEEFAQMKESISSVEIPKHTAEEIISRLLTSRTMSLTEFELLRLVMAMARRHNIDIRPNLPLIDFSALAPAQKHEVSFVLGLTPDEQRQMWNSVIRSNIIAPTVVWDRDLGKPPLKLQRLYSSHIQGLASFFEYLKPALLDYYRRLIIVKIDGRFSAGIFIRGDMSWEEDVVVDENICVCAFLSTSSSPMSQYKQTTKGYQLHCSDNVFQLFLGHRAVSFVFLKRAPKGSKEDIIASIALNTISTQTAKQVGRVLKTPVLSIEIHVVSNRDRLANQIFDMRYEHVPTDERMRRFAHQDNRYTLNTLTGVDWTQVPGHFKEIFEGKMEIVKSQMENFSGEQLDELMEFATKRHVNEQLFWLFEAMFKRTEPDVVQLARWIPVVPPLVFCLLKQVIIDDSGLPMPFTDIIDVIVQGVISAANDVGIVSLVALEKLRPNILTAPLGMYVEWLWLTSMAVRPAELVQEMLLVLNESRDHSAPLIKYAQKQALGIAFDRAEEAANECPCDEFGRPKPRQRQAPINTRLYPVDGEVLLVKADIRVDSPSPIRLHSHVRLKAASSPERGVVEKVVLDGLVKQSVRGEIKIQLMHPLPPEFAEMHWNIYNAGSTATSRAMMDAVLRLAEDQAEACIFHAMITDAEQEDPILTTASAGIDHDSHLNKFNESQQMAIRQNSMLSLIWGPPGTGKTTVVIEILRRFLHNRDEDCKILMTASTHNAVDNVLERFAALNILKDEQLLRVATDHSKVSKNVKKFTIDALLGGSPTDDPKLIKKAEKRVKQAVIVFTTCTGAGLGVLRQIKYDTVLIDEASQVTEPCALIPLVKGCRRAVLVGDHVQLRPTVRPMAKALQFDISLLERLYRGDNFVGMSRTMLNVQYRFPEELARFPSQEFYEGRLQTGTNDDGTLQKVLQGSEFPWPRRADGNCLPNVFIHCPTEEDMGGQSKSNKGQADLVRHIIKLLQTPRVQTGADMAPEVPKHSIGTLTPYTKQVRLIQGGVPGSVPVSTVDGFQGRECDIVVFSTVRSNAVMDLGFLDDERRLNVALTRAKFGRIIVGDRVTLGASDLWKRAMEDSEEVVIQPQSE